MVLQVIEMNLVVISKWAGGSKYFFFLNEWELRIQHVHFAISIIYAA